jgi:hypothetical protein
MKLPLLLAVAVTLGCSGCRQPDGRMPTPVRDQSNEITDVARDMINIVNKDPQAPEDLRSDLSKYGDNASAVAKANELAKAVAAALPGARLEDETANQLARTLWVGLTATELSERQVDTLKRDVKATLASAGVEEGRAQPVADKLGEVQSVVTKNPKRWYQLF